MIKMSVNQVISWQQEAKQCCKLYPSKESITLLFSPFSPNTYPTHFPESSIDPRDYTGGLLIEFPASVFLVTAS